TTNLQRLGDEWSRSAEMSVYLADDATVAERASIEALLAPGPIVAAVEYVAKAQALERFKQSFADLASTMGTLESNPLPASYEVRLQPSMGTSAAVDGLAQKLQA